VRDGKWRSDESGRRKEEGKSERERRRTGRGRRKDELRVDVGNGVLETGNDNMFESVDTTVRHLNDFVEDNESGLKRDIEEEVEEGEEGDKKRRKRRETYL
jgi:hypothetical protein